MLGAGAGGAQDGGGVGAMDFFWTYLWPLIVIVAESAAAAGRAAGRDRLHPARRPQDLGGGADAARPQRGRALGPVPVLRRSVEIRAQGAGDPGRRQQGRVPAGAARHLRAGARRLGGDAGQCRLGDRQHQCRRALHLRHLVADGLRRHHGGLGVEFEILRSSPRCARPRRWCPTRSRSASSSSPCCCAPAR